MAYVHSTLNYRQSACAGDSIDQLSLHLYTDADMAGDNRSTSGVYLAIEGPRTWFPIASISKRQTAVSHSTPEKEVVAGTTGLRVVGLPGLELWEALVKMTKGEPPPRPGKRDNDECPLVFHAVNESMISVCNTGKNPTMRHIGRTHGISIAWLNQETSRDYCMLESTRRTWRRTSLPNSSQKR